MAEIWLVRHGQASFGSDNYDQLSNRGRRQMELLAEHMEKSGATPSSLLSGEMQRQRDSASIVSEKLNLGAPDSNPAFNEFSHMPIITAYAAQLARDTHVPQDWSALREDRHAFEKFFADATRAWANGTLEGDGIEPWMQFIDRATAALHALVARSSRGEHLVVMTSAGTIAVTLKSVLNLSTETALRLSWVILNSSVTRLVHDGQRITLTGFNSIAHLEIADEKGLVTTR